MLFAFHIISANGFRLCVRPATLFVLPQRQRRQLNGLGGMTQNPCWRLGYCSGEDVLCHVLQSFYSSLAILQKKVQKFQVRQPFVIYNCQRAAWIKINNSPEEHDHARLQMSSITRLGLIAN
jgi:hypothetical protein